DDPIVTSGMFGIRDDGSDIIRTAQCVGHTADGEELVSACDGVTAIADVLGSLIRGTEQTKCSFTCCSRQLASPERINNPASVHRSAHVAITGARAGDIEQSHALHEKRTLLRKEDRKALVDLNLE